MSSIIHGSLAILFAVLLGGCEISSNSDPDITQNKPALGGPVVQLEREQMSVEIGQDVWLDASGSYSSEESSGLSFEWSGSDDIKSPNKAQTWVHNLPVGVHQIRLTISDGERTQTAAVTVDVTLPKIVESGGIDTGNFQNPKTVYFNLETAKIIPLTEQEARDNDQWHIAFRRTSIFLNRHTTPPVALHFVGNTDYFYNQDGTPNNNRFFNASADSERDAFLAFTGELPEDTTFATDQEIPAITDFYHYDLSSHSVTANPDAHFIVRAHDGYAKFRVNDITQAGRGMAAIEFGYSLQPEGATQFSPWQTLAVSTQDCTEAILVDFGSGRIVSLDENWHIAIPCETNMGTFAINIAEHAHALTGESAKVDGVDSQNIPANNWVENQTVLSALVEHGDPRSTYGWGEYNLADGHQLWPNYALYVIDTGSDLYKFQVLDYYDPEDPSRSGHYTVRHQRIYENAQ